MASVVTSQTKFEPVPPDGDVLYEVVNGEVREVPPMSRLAALVASVLAQSLGTFASQHKRGLVAVEMLFRLTTDGRRQRRPDVAFVAYERLPDPIFTEDDPPAWDVVPNLAVEVVSPSNTANELLEKTLEYFAAGVQLVWVIYPRHRRVFVYEPPASSRILLEQDELDGGTVLPGFRLSVAALFDALTKPT
ncbi:MAG TPA: Uma2 family endonuclease [Gemmataceae bacterium]|jgi:Uma2 family endonuclease|nr:Uma2 family endonuclease [Gemmataceae bacterium]